MAGQSNTQGHGEISPSTTQGTLGYIATPANDPEGKYQFLKDGADWAVRGDVRVHYQRNVPLGSGVDVGDLSPGFGASSGKTTIGPELGFGHAMGAFYEEQILIIKCSWGGKSLGLDFLPPSSESYPTPVAEGDKGFFYQKILEIVDDVTANIAVHVPGYNAAGGYEIAGFCWHQGWNDRVTPAFSAAYETNMANFIRDIRNDLGVPNLPFVIATSAMDGNGPAAYTQVELAQRAMTNTSLSTADPPDPYTDFIGSVAVVDCRQTYDGWAYSRAGFLAGRWPIHPRTRATTGTATPRPTSTSASRWRTRCPSSPLRPARPTCKPARVPPAESRWIGSTGTTSPPACRSCATASKWPPRFRDPPPASMTPPPSRACSNTNLSSPCPAIPVRRSPPPSMAASPDSRHSALEEMSRSPGATPWSTPPSRCCRNGVIIEAKPRRHE